jgi:hypothetical protein
MATETSVANLALGRLKVGQAIADIDDQSNPARLCARFMDQCRQEVLRAFPWGGTVRAEALAEISMASFPGWTYVYQYPNSCLMVRAVSDEGGIRHISQSITSRFEQLNTLLRKQPFQIALKDDNTARTILSDVTDAYVFYTVDVEAFELFAPDLASAIAWRLAMEVGGPLQADSAAIENAMRMYAISVSTASAQSLNEHGDDPMPDSESIACRY